MNKNSVQNNKLTIKDIAILGVMVATMTSFKYALSLLPNIEPVSLLIILYTLFLGPKVIYAIVVFVFVEGLIYGFGSWWICYLYIWPILSLLTHFLGKIVTDIKQRVLAFSVLSAVFGLFFGALTSIPQFLIGGLAYGFSYFIAGIPYDLIHCVGNFVICLALFYPLHTTLNKISKYIS